MIAKCNKIRLVAQAWLKIQPSDYQHILNELIKYSGMPYPLKRKIMTLNRRKAKDFSLEKLSNDPKN